MRIMMRQKGIELNTHDKPKLKEIMIKPEHMAGLMEFYNGRVEREKNLKIIAEVRKKNTGLLFGGVYSLTFRPK